MRKLLFFFIFLTVLSCKDETIVNNCFPTLSVNKTINLNTPEFINLQTPNSEPAYTTGGFNGILLFRTQSTYKAFDRRCPENNCDKQMILNYPSIECPCDGKKYNAINGGSPQNGSGCFAKEYRVLISSSSTLVITN